MATLLITREGLVTAEMLNNSNLIVQIEREFDEPCDDPCEGCPLLGSFSTDSLIACASCSKAG